jgi:6-phosphogluconolactonase
MEVVITDNAVEVAADFFAERFRAGTADGRRFSVAFSGGRTPLTVLERLAEADDVSWELIDVYQVDERIAPAGNSDRNLTQLNDALLSRVPVVLHAMPVEANDLAEAARQYAAILPRALDLVHLGLGGDGHTASLVPGDPVLDVTDRDVAVTNAYQGRQRMTLTYSTLNRAKSIVWIVTGAAKQDALHQLLAGDKQIPAGHVSRSRALVITDIAHET